MGKITINGKDYHGNNVTMRDGNVYIDGNLVGGDGPVRLAPFGEKRVRIEVEGVLQSLTVHHGDVECGAVAGDVRCDGSVTCKDVQGNVQAGGSARCDGVGGSVNAGGSVQCGAVGGGVNAGGSVRHVHG